MHLTENKKSWRTTAYAIAVIGLATAVLWFGAQFNSTEANTNNLTLASAPAATFGGSGFGNIPSPASGCWGATPITPLNVTFNVTGVSGTPTNVEVSHTLTHSWVGDIRATLIAPNASSHILYSRTGATTSAATGDSSNMVGPYNIKDSAVGTNWWTAAANETTGTAPVPAGDYKSTTPGGAAGGGTNTDITPSFASVSDPTGTWTLRLEDGCAGDTGAISAATLTIDAGSPPVNTQHVVDFDGNGRSDFAVVRNTGGGAMGQVTWFIALNGPGTTNGYAWGIATDFFVPEDYDGDDKTDIAIWRPLSTGQPSGNAFFYILQSATNTVRIDDFGQSGDDPTVVGDYDGDGSADPAVYRGGATSGAPSFWFWRGSLTPGNVSAAQWGQNGDFPAPGDYDGDGKNDFVIQRNAGGGQAAFWMNQTMAGLQTIIFGTPTDVIVPGDYDGDGKTDIATIRGSAGSILWWHRRSSDGGIVGATWGLSATDFPVQGDYDGDGKTDLAIWRPSATPGNSAFWYFGSTSGTVGAAFGQNGDYPVANYNSH